MHNQEKNAIVLCSGGLDSIVTANLVRTKGYNKIYVLYFNYGQKSSINEMFYSKECAKEIDAEFIEIKLEWLGKISESLINKKGKISKLSKQDLKDTKEESEKYYVPCRNIIFLSYALALAETICIKGKKVCNIYVGFKCEGRESYPDTTKEFVDSMNKLSKIGCSNKINVIAPLIKKDKEDIINLGKKLGVDFKKTFSCYISDKKGKHCGNCLACMLRKAGFYWAGAEDPTKYIS